jgi:cell division protein ZapA
MTEESETPRNDSAAYRNHKTKTSTNQMGERSIRSTIAGRTYPLTVDAKEEPRVVRAASLINERVQQLESTYAVKDKQDLLAMTALQFASQYLESQSKVVDDHETLLAELDKLEQMIDVHLAASNTSV